MTSWIIWAMVLMSQNFASVLQSRARQSSSLLFLGLACSVSNGIWIISQFILVDKMVEVLKNSNWLLALGVGVFYVFFALIGSLASQYFCIRHLEKRFQR